MHHIYKKDNICWDCKYEYEIIPKSKSEVKYTPLPSKKEEYPSECKCSKKKEKKCHKIDNKPKLSVLEAVSTGVQTVLSGLSVIFTSNLVSVGSSIFHIPGSPEFRLLNSGVYRVTFTGTVSPEPEITTTGVAFSLNGMIIQGTTITERTDVSGNVSLTTQALIRVFPSFNSVLTVVNPTAIAQTFTNPNVIIERIE